LSYILQKEFLATLIINDYKEISFFVVSLVIGTALFICNTFIYIVEDEKSDKKIDKRGKAGEIAGNILVSLFLAVISFILGLIFVGIFVYFLEIGIKDLLFFITAFLVGFVVISFFWITDKNDPESTIRDATFGKMHYISNGNYWVATKKGVLPLLDMDYNLNIEIFVILKKEKITHRQKEAYNNCIRKVNKHQKEIDEAIHKLFKEYYGIEYKNTDELHEQVRKFVFDLEIGRNSEWKLGVYFEPYFDTEDDYFYIIFKPEIKVLVLNDYLKEEDVLNARY